MSRHLGPGPIPDRWLYCPRNANSFVAEKFLAFKTPLSDRFTTQMPMECQFLPEMVFSYAKMFKVKIYYNSMEEQIGLTTHNYVVG